MYCNNKMLMPSFKWPSGHMLGHMLGQRNGGYTQVEIKQFRKVAG